MSHHWITEEEMKTRCYDCGSSLADKAWSSIFTPEKHYKNVKCECGTVTNMPVNFLGSGADSWDGTLSWESKLVKPKSIGEVKITTLDNKVAQMTFAKK